MKLEDRVAIVTGASKGIGAGIAREFSREGAIVVVVSRGEAEGLAMAEELGSKEGRAVYVQTDVTKCEDIQTLISKTTETFGKLDMLVNNAGYHISNKIEECGKAAVYLASDDAAFVTGITLNIDGGITLGY